MAKTDFKSIDEYHQVFSGETLKRLQVIRKIINEVVPTVEECISYQIPCFKYKGYLIYYCAYAKHISLSNPFSAAFLSHFKNELKDLKVSKSAIQFPTDKPLPEKIIKKMIEFRKKENEEKENNKKK